jgi:hypothetical protein
MVREYERVQAETRRTVQDWFTQTVARVGEAKAREYFSEVVKRKGGKPKGTTNARRDTDLLIWYDEFVRLYPSTKHRQMAPRLIGDWVYKTHGRQYGSGAAAITTHLRRLLSRRRLRQSGTGNALSEYTRTGIPPVLEQPWDTNI